jgi:hypothetical protein
MKLIYYIIYIVCVLITFICIAIIGTVGLNTYCKYHPSLHDGDTCFNTEYRCNWECSNYNLTYYGGFEQPCWCLCGFKDKVSICSGEKVSINE